VLVLIFLVQTAWHVAVGAALEGEEMTRYLIEIKLEVQAPPGDWQQTS